jgi:hypothetical protein
MEQMECWNTGEKVSPASLVLPLVRRSQSGIVSFTVSPTQSVRHRHSGIDVSPVPLVTEQSGSAQLRGVIKTKPENAYMFSIFDFKEGPTKDQLFRGPLSTIFVFTACLSENQLIP